MSGLRYGFTEAFKGALEIAQRDFLTRQDAVITLWREVKYLRREMKSLEAERDKFFELAGKDRLSLDARIQCQRAEIARLHEAEDAAVRSGKEQFERANNAEAQLASIAALLSQIAESPEPREALWTELYRAALQKGGAK